MSRAGPWHFHLGFLLSDPEGLITPVLPGGGDFCHCVIPPQPSPLIGLLILINYSC